MFSTFFIVVLAIFAVYVRAESHTVKFQNNCGKGTPVLLAAGTFLANGSDYTSNGPIQSAISYLQTGQCLENGENCAIVEMNINNPTCAGCGPSVDISLISPHALNVPVAFAFYGGTGDTCDGLGAVCSTDNCDTAFFQPNDNQVQRACQADNVNLLITFCGSETTQFTEAVAGSLASLVSGSSSESVSSSAASSPAASHSSSAEASPSSSAAATPTSSAIINVAEPSISAPASVSASVSPSLSSSAASPSKTCSRKRSVRAKRSASLSKHAQYRHRARALAGAHGTF